MDVESIDPKTVIKVGQRAKVSLASEQSEELYTTRIEDVNSKSITLAMPMYRGCPIIPLKGSMVSVVIFTEQATYRFCSLFLDKEMAVLPIWKISWPTKMEKYQQRSFVRVDVVIPLTLQIKDEEENLSEPISANSRNISGGGLSIVLDRKINTGTVLHVETDDIPIVGKLKVDCKVMRSERPVEGRRIYWIGLKFIDINDREQAQLVRYIFLKQRELLSNRLIE